MSKKDRLRRPLRARMRPYLILAPAMALLIGVLYPFGMAIYYSFTSYSLTRPITRFVGLRNYRAMFADDNFLYSTFITFAYAILATGIELLLGMAVALLLNRELRLAKALRTVLIFPMMIAPVIGTLIWKLMMQPSVGILNPMFNAVGLPSLEWAAVPETALISVLLVDIWMFTPFVALLLLAGLRSLPQTPFEAAKVDGAKPWFIFRNLTLPMLTPILIICITFRLMDSLKMFDIIYAMTTGGPGNTLMTYQLETYTRGFIYLRLGQSLPFAILLFVIIYLSSQWLIRWWSRAQRRAAGIS